MTKWTKKEKRELRKRGYFIYDVANFPVAWSNLGPLIPNKKRKNV